MSLYPSGDRLHEHDKEYGEAASLYTKYLAMTNTTGVSCSYYFMHTCKTLEVLLEYVFDVRELLVLLFMLCKMHGQ